MFYYVFIVLVVGYGFVFGSCLGVFCFIIVLIGEDFGEFGVGLGGYGGYDVFNWSCLKSFVILMGVMVFYVIVVEILVDIVDVVLENFEIDEKFFGIMFFVFVFNIIEFLNVILFVMNGNIVLFMEIGFVYVFQVCFLQILVFVLFLVFYFFVGVFMEDVVKFIFSLFFLQWDMVMVILCVFLFSYMYGEGKSNYFKGSILLFSYLVVIIGFYFSGYGISFESLQSIVS